MTTCRDWAYYIGRITGRTAGFYRASACTAWRAPYCFTTSVHQSLRPSD